MDKNCNGNVFFNLVIKVYYDVFENLAAWYKRMILQKGSISLKSDVVGGFLVFLSQAESC